MSAPSLVVVGGGLSGLVAAYQLRRDLPDASITVVESSDRLGGVLDTVDFPSGPVELGAEAFLGRRPEAAELVEELGLTAVLRHPSPLTPAILTGGRLVPMPVGTIMGLPSEVAALSGVLPDADLRVAALEETTPLEWERGADVALGEFVAQRFGRAVVTRLVDPMLGGVYAAPCSGLGLREVVPGLADRLDEGAPSITAAVRDLVSRGVPGPVFATFSHGYRTLVEALAAASGARILTSTRCTAIETDDRSVTVTTSAAAGSGSDRLRADAVVLAVPAPVATSLLGGVAPPAAERLGEVRTASSAVVALEVDRTLELPDHSGVLVATDEPVPFKAMTFSSRKWPHLDTRPCHVLRVSFGRLGDEEVLDHDDAALTRLAVAALAGVCGGEPRNLHARVRRWTNGLPEIGPGHDDRLAEARAALAAAAPEVELVGSATEGVGVPACIGSARAAARRLSVRWQD